VGKMTKKILGQLVLSATLMVSAVAPAMALDYEAKPVMWVLQAPFRTVGAVSGAIVSGGISGPIDDGYHWFLKGTNHVAEKFGDEKGWGQRAAAVPIGGSTGLVLGSAHGVYRGVFHGLKKGWEKPFSRWSFITMEEK
jgi:hypothetical protein